MKPAGTEKLYRLYNPRRSGDIVVLYRLCGSVKAERSIKELVV